MREKYNKFKEKFYNESLYKEVLGFELTELTYHDESVYDMDYEDKDTSAYYILGGDIQIKLNAFKKITSMYVVGERAMTGIIVTGVLKNFKASFADFLEANLFTKSPLFSDVTPIELIEYNMKLSDISRIIFNNYKDNIVNSPTFIEYELDYIGSASILTNVNAVSHKRYEFGGYMEMIDNLETFKYIYGIRFNTNSDVYYVYGLTVEDDLNA